MIVLDYQKKNHKSIIAACVHALKQGKAVVYPTDTSYGLAVDATNVKAIKKLYKIKERGFNQPVHVIVPSLTYAKKVAKWNKIAEKLTKKFWPGPLTLVLLVAPRRGAASNDGTPRRAATSILSAGTGFIGLRLPKNDVALDLAKYLKRPITTTSANLPSRQGWDDNYSADEVVQEFSKTRYAPDIIINAGKLPKRKPSTMVKIIDDKIEILRQGPVTQKQILNFLLNTK